MRTCQWKLDWDDQCQAFVSACLGNRYPLVRGTYELYYLIKDEKPCHFCGNPIDAEAYSRILPPRLLKMVSVFNGLDKTR